MECRKPTGGSARHGARWRLEGWVRELGGDEVAALMRCIADGAGEEDDLLVEGLVLECAGRWCPHRIPAGGPAGRLDACPGFCAALPYREGRW